MTNIIKKAWQKLWVLRWLPSIVRFNLHYLPLRQAIKLPILLYRPHLRKLKGKITINGHIHTGMITLGYPSVSLYPRTGIVYENHGGEITFNGDCFIGSASAISIGTGATLSFGRRIMANAAIKIACYHRINISDDCRLSWETLMFDTDFHTLTRSDGSHTRGYAPIYLGRNCWIGTGCTILKGTSIPDFTTVQARTVLSKRYDIPPKCVIGSSTQIIVKAQDTYRDLSDNNVHYE